MEEQQRFRHEWKYLISTAQIPMIHNRLNRLMTSDIHADHDGGYRVRSLYFDDDNNSCYYENENGIDPREKFRIRIYDGNTDRILLECKRKERGMTMKTSCMLTREQAEQLMLGNPLPDLENQPQPLRKLTLQMLTKHLHPVAIVEYDRIVYVYPNGNVRVTIDTNIAASSAVWSFFEQNVPKRPVMASGQHILEVKYDAYLPDFLYRNLQLQNLQQIAFSKYYICRKYMR